MGVLQHYKKMRYIGNEILLHHSLYGILGKQTEIQIYCFLRPEIFNCVKFRDESQVGLPCFALVILEEPERPSVG